MRPPMNFLRLKPPVIAFALLGASLLLHFLLPAGIALRFGTPWLGSLCFLAGLTIMLWAWSLFMRAGTALLPTGEPSRFVQAGPYRFTRNPMYLGITLILLGVALYLGSLPMLLAPVLFPVIINRVFVPHEEGNMERIFGQDYRDFKKRVRRWV